MRHGDEVGVRKEDDRPIKVTILAQLAKVSELKNRLIFQTPTPPGTQNGPTIDSQNPDQAVKDFINTLPEPQRRSLLEFLEQQTGISKENT